MNHFNELNLDPNIAKAIVACGYTTPTPVQAQSIPSILDGKDIVATAQTGTGKTAAFVLPALHRLAQQGASKKTRVLILTPTRELASQITKAAGLYGKFLQYKIVNLVGGMPYHHQIKDLARGADIIVATPGRLMDHMESKRVDLSHVEMLVLDEADRMLDMGFIEDVEYIAKMTPANRQTLLFSATMDKQLTTIVKHLLKSPVRVDLSSERMTAPKIKQEAYRTQSPQHKTRLLKHILHDDNIFKAIIFCATKIMADKLADQLSDEGFAAAALHGDLRQNVRNRTIEQLRRGKIQFLVATDVAARGIDIGDVTHVINYDLPRFSEDYVHRIGRTGRAGKTGVAISFILPSDNRHLQRIEKYINQRIKLMSNIELPNTPANDKAHEKPSFDASWDDERFDRKGRRDHQSANRDGYKKRTSGGESKPFKQRDDFKHRRDDRASDEERPARRKEFKSRDDRDGGFKRRDDKREDRDSSFKRRDSSGRNDRDGEFKRRDGKRDDREHGFKQRDDFKHRRDDRASDEERPARRKEFKSRDDRDGGFKRRDDRDSGFKRRDSSSRDDRDGEFKRRDGKRDDREHSFKRGDDKRDGKYADRDNERKFNRDGQSKKRDGAEKRSFSGKKDEKRSFRKTINDNHQPPRQRVASKKRDK